MQSAAPVPQPQSLEAALSLLAQIQAAFAQTQAQLQTQLQAAQQENRLLREKLQAFIRRYFGTQTEALDPNQLQLLLAGLESAPVAPAPAAPAVPPPTPARSSEPKTRRPARSGLPTNLPEERHELIPAEVQAHPEQFRTIGQEITRELDWKPAQFFFRVFVRPKFVRKAPAAAATDSNLSALTENQGAIPTNPTAVLSERQTQRRQAVGATLANSTPVDPVEVWIAPLPNRLIEKGLPGVGLLVEIICNRFDLHLPFYRQEKMFLHRHGVRLSRQSLQDWTEQVATWLQPIYRAMIRETVTARYLQADETPVDYLDGERPGRARQGYFWVYALPRGNVIFDWQTSRGRDGPRAFLKDFQGCLQTDGYEVYPSLAREHPAWILIGCWAHARRKFFEAKDLDWWAAWVLKQIGLLYAVEKRLRLQQAGPALRQAVRAAESAMVLRRLHRVLTRLQERALPQSLLGKAVRYTLDRWTELTRFVDHGHVEIDNNGIENAIRPTAIGKKNFLFIGHPDAGWRSAVIYSIIGTCHRLGIAPHKYLQDVLTRLPDLKQSAIPSLTPMAWSKDHPEARVPLPPR